MALAFKLARQPALRLGGYRLMSWHFRPLAMLQRNC